MTRFLTAITLAAFTATSAHAGGPVIVEDATEAAPAPRHNKVPAWVIVALGAVVVAAISGGGSDACNGDPEPEPTPEPVGGC
jgi:hypothetical protein